ncbi:MAG: DNA-binding protein WhiA [Clostridia bacterium]|nr:DNA-binding protein WhiA [Clostridia bacterium]
MSFSGDIKKEICSLNPENDCCIKAKCYGMMLFSAKFGADSILFKTEKKDVATHYFDLVKKVCDVELDIVPPEKERGMYLVCTNDAKKCKTILDVFGHSENQLHLRINRSNIENECCFGAFISGVFLSCGSISDPNKAYHGEFLVSKKHLANDLSAILGECISTPKATLRKSSNVLYYKESEKIEELLTLMNAVKSVFELMNVKIYKDMRNHINRTSNCITANISKTAESVRKQMDAISLIDEKIGLEALPSDLYDMAIVRRDNDFASLSELGRLMVPPLSRSGVNHRLNRIVEIAKGLE